MNEKELMAGVAYLNLINSAVVVLKKLDSDHWRVLWEFNEVFEARDMDARSIIKDQQCHWNDPVGLEMIKTEKERKLNNVGMVLHDYPHRYVKHVKDFMELEGLMK